MLSTLIYIDCEHGKFNIAKNLVDHEGENINEESINFGSLTDGPTSSFGTPIYIICKNGNEILIKYLIDMVQI